MFYHRYVFIPGTSGLSSPSNILGGRSNHIKSGRTKSMTRATLSIIFSLILKNLFTTPLRRLAFSSTVPTLKRPLPSAPTVDHCRFHLAVMLTLLAHGFNVVLKHLA